MMRETRKIGSVTLMNGLSDIPPLLKKIKERGATVKGDAPFAESQFLRFFDFQNLKLAKDGD